MNFSSIAKLLKIDYPLYYVEDQDLKHRINYYLSLLDKTTPSSTVHSINVANYAVGFSEFINSNICKEEMYTGAVLHDIGKITIEKNILEAKRTLTETEMEKVKTHISAGKFLLENDSFSLGVMDIVYFHHERDDGNGYLKIPGSLIPLGAKIVAICDTFDVLISDRPYRSKTDINTALKVIAQTEGQFDPVLKEQFIKFIRESQKKQKGK